METLPVLAGSGRSCGCDARTAGAAGNLAASSPSFGSMTGLLRLAAIGFVMLVVSWAVLIVLARRLPPGILKDLAGILPACATTMRRLRRHPGVPRSARVAVVFALVWVVSPIDLIPEFIPVIGPLDDIVVVALALRYAARKIPADVLFEAWPADPRLLARLIGRPAPPPIPEGTSATDQ